MSNLKQYTITHNCDWEGEEYGFIMMLTDEQYIIINAAIIESDSEEFEIEQTNYSPKEVKIVQKHDKNSYMASLAFYVFRDENPFDIELDEEESILDVIFYKGRGLK